jgi:hypothetical protein
MHLKELEALGFLKRYRLNNCQSLSEIENFENLGLPMLDTRDNQDYHPIPLNFTGFQPKQFDQSNCPHFMYHHDP